MKIGVIYRGPVRKGHGETCLICRRPLETDAEVVIYRMPDELVRIVHDGCWAYLQSCQVG